MTGKIFTKSLAAVLGLSALGLAQPIGKTGPCPTFTRTDSYNGQALTGGPAFTGKSWQVTPPSSLTSSGQIQEPLSPVQSVNCVQVPPGLKAEIVASELTPGPAPAMSYPMNFTFDERGRMWVVEPRDYPYTHYTSTGADQSPAALPTNRLQGQSRILILEDTNGDGAMDNYKVFYTGLALATSLELVKGGVIATVPPNIYFIPNVNDVGGTPIVVVSNMGSTSTTYDTHGQTNSLTYGLDNFIYGHAGYNGCGTPTINGVTGPSCGTGAIYRFKATAIGSDSNGVQIHTGTNSNNAHGIGQMEDGQWFKSHATVTTHSYHVPRHGAGAQNTQPSTNTYFLSPTNDRWLWEGNNTSVNSIFGARYRTRSSAVSGHDFYTARLLPQRYWNRLGFVCEGASKLCNMDSMVFNGSSWRRQIYSAPDTVQNIFGSTDAWTAPLKVRTGPDGGLWVLDWYNYLFLHNPATPAQNAAWISPLRKKTRARFYRILPDNGQTQPVLNLTNASDAELVATFWNTNFVWRLMAQRLLLWKTRTTAEKDALLTLLENVLTQHRTEDAVGIDGPVLHALWTLHGLREFADNPTRWDPILKSLLLHPAWTVRRNVALAMPGTAASFVSIKDQCAVNDVHAHVRVQALQNLTRMPASGGPIESVDGLRSGDTHIGNAYTAAGTSKVTSVTGSARPSSCPAYLTASADLAGYPAGVGVARGRSVEARNQLRFNITGNGFELLTQHGQLASGELTVYDLRGHAAFRSTYNAARGEWSQRQASGLGMSVYLYTFRAIDGDSFNGRILLRQDF